MRENTQNEIVQTLYKFKQVFYAIGIFTVVINILMLVPSMYMMEVYDRVLASHNQYTLIMLTVMAAGLYGLTSVIEYFRSMVVLRIGAKMDAELNQRVYTAAFEQNLTKDSVNAGQALNDLSTIKQFVTGVGVFAFFDAPWFPIYLAIIFMFNPWLGLFALVSTSLLIGLAWFNELVSSKALKDASDAAVRSGNMASNTLRNAEVIDAMGMLPSMRTRWYSEHTKFLDLQQSATQRTHKITSVTKFVRTAAQSLILGVAALLVIKGEVTAGMMIASSILLGRTLAPVEQIIGVWRQWAGVVSAYKRLDKLLTDNPARKPGMTLPKPVGRLNVEGVSAAPAGTTVPVLKNLNFGINAGDCLGVIGQSGAGKSTLARLLVGIGAPTIGTVRLDGADISKWNKDELGPHIGYLPQDIELFAGTISDNIARFGNVDPEAVVKAATLAGVHDMILRMPNGYDTVIGVDGSGLSGGEKQRVALARALYNDPAVIVLDEPNSNLDQNGEFALAQALRQLRLSGTTIVLITHRPEIIQETTHLMVLHNGMLTGFGPTEKVLSDIMNLNKVAQPSE
jgi:ATP-binding cassette, subfamily C, bacterial exporter for protease/lipase